MSPAACVVARDVYSGPCWRLVRDYLDDARRERRLGSRIGRVLAISRARYWASRASGLDHEQSVRASDAVWQIAARRAA